MPTQWMITNRNQKNGELGPDEAPLTYWRTDKGGGVDRLRKLNHWTELDAEDFARALAAQVDEHFPDLPESEHEGEHHVSLFVHGFNNSFPDALGRYLQIHRALLRGPKLGICVLFTWPSDGSPAGYFPDRRDARRSADELADVLSLLFDQLARRQTAAMRKGSKCTAKTSIIAHSMGNYLLQKAMQTVWTRKNQPLLLSLVNQLVMVAADVDNDLFGSGETVDGSDGDAMANLSYRITALYSGLDPVLGLSAGLKHFGKRRLGRSGLDRTLPLPDNVCQMDCSGMFGKVKPADVHSAYFDVARTQELIVGVLRGIDREVLKKRFPEIP